MISISRNKAYVVVLFLILLLTLLGTLTINISSPDLHIKITNVNWLPTLDSQTDTYVLYHTHVKCEIWNPHDYNLTLSTPNLNLLDSKISFRLDKDYDIRTGNIAFPMIANHTIMPGISQFVLVINFEIHGYNSSSPPSGTYTLWVEIDSETVPFEVKTYKTNISHKNNQTSKIKHKQAPLNWGAMTWYPVNTGVFILLLSLFSEAIIAIGVFLKRTIRKFKNST